MADSFYKLEDEAFPSFLCKSLDSTSGRATLVNVTLGSGPGLPVAASTVAKIRPGSDNRGDPADASYLEDRALQQASSHSSVGEQPKFSLGFKDDLDNADDFIAAHRLSDMLVKIDLDESAFTNQGSIVGFPPTQTGSVQGRPTELGTDLSTGLLTFAQFGRKDSIDAKPFPATAEEDNVQSEGVDSDHFSGSNSSFLANEKLMSVDSMNSDITDDDIDSNNLPDDELELYFNKLVPPAMQRGRVEGQEIPATGLPGAADDVSNPSSTEPEQYRHHFLDDYNQEEFRMPDVRLAATGMDSCPASDEDTEDELESARRNNNASRTRLLPSTSRQLVGESNRPSFRPGLEGGSSDDESSSGRGGPSLTGIEHRRSAEGQVINPPVTGDGGGGDGSSGSEESGNDGGVSTIPFPMTNVQTTYDVLRGLGIVGSSAVGEDEDGDLNNLPGHGRNSLSEMGDRVGPVGTGEASSSFGASGGTLKLSPVNWSMVLDRQEALNAMESTDSGPTIDRLLDPVYLRSGAGLKRSQDLANLTFSHLQGTQGSFHLSQVVLPECSDEDDDGDGVDVPDGARPFLGLRNGPCGDVTGAEASAGTSEDDDDPLSTSLEPKYFSQSFHQDQEDSDEGWNHCPDNMELEFQKGANATHGVVYQNEEGQWVTDLAYYSSFEKEVDGKTSGEVGPFQTEEFVPSSDALEKIVKDQEEFEKEHQFIQEEQIEPASSNNTFHSDSSWKVPTNSHVLMRASQVSSEFQQGDQSYLRLSFGQFFGQRSEALGCLGNSDDVEAVKRPSFGYIITSPEKREPFALIHPAEFSARHGSPQNDTTNLSEADKTLNPEDLDKTLEAPCERMSPKDDTDPEPCAQEDPANGAALPDHTQHSASESSFSNQSSVSPDNNSSHLMSISTIASAIADASISTDPSQLAAMIMELSKRSRGRTQPEATAPGGPAVNSTEEPHSAEHILLDADPRAMMDTLQRSTCVGELSGFDMEKYLKKTDLSGSSDASVAHTTFDLTSWAENFSCSQRNTLAGCPEEQGSSAPRVASESQQKPTSTKIGDKDRRGEKTLNTSSRAAALSNASTQIHKVDSKRSSIPGSCTPFSSARRSVGSGQSSNLKPTADKMSACDNSAFSATKSFGRILTENVAKSEKLNPQASNSMSSYLEASQSGFQRTSPGMRKGQSGAPLLQGSSLLPQRESSAGQQQHNRLSCSPEKKQLFRNIMAAPLTSVEKHVGFSCQNTQPPLDSGSDLPKGFSEPYTEETQCNFRPSTSPLTHSSPSQTSIPSADCLGSPASSSGGLPDKRPVLDLSPQSTCSSPSISRLTYISMNDGTVIPTPERQKNNCTMALSTTIIRFSPTPPVEPDAQANLDIPGQPKSLDQVQAKHSKSLDLLPAQQCRSPEPFCSGSALTCTRSQSECNYHCPEDGTSDLSAGFRNHGPLTESNVRQLTKVDSGYCSNLNIQQTSSAAAPHSSQQWGATGSVSSSVYGGGLGMPPSYTAEGLHYVPIPSFKPQSAGMIDLPHQGDMQSLPSGHSLFNAQLSQYLGPEALLHPGVYHVGATGNGVFSVSSTGIPNNNLMVRHAHHTSGPLGMSGAVGSHNLPRVQCQQDMGMMGKPYDRYGAEPMVAGGLEELKGQVMVQEELRFPHTCCVGIASQTSLSLFNPSERWQQVSINVTSLAIDGEKVESLPYQWLIVKNKTIIGPKSTEEQKVLFIPPQAGVYQCVLSVCSWPASAETEVAARANIFAKRVVLVAIAENPALEIEVGKSGCLDFGDLPGGSAESLPVKLLNRTHATVPIRLVISANAAAWRCFTFSKHPVTLSSEGPQQDGHMTPVSSPSVMNHVMHASYGENPQSFVAWVHFKAPQKYTASSGELGPAQEYSARVDIEVDSPGPSHVIRSIPLRARSGTARVHAPKDLQTVSLSAPLGKSCQQMLPLKNAGNIDVQLKLKRSNAEDSFSVTPDELSLRVGEEQSIMVSFKAQGSRKYQESLLTILVLPSGPQYEVTLKGEVVPENSGKPAIPPAAVLCPGLANDVPPILSNKQFVAWGGVTLGRAVQQKLVLRNNSTNVTQQLRLLIRGQDQDCFQLQSMFSPEERLTRHGELSIRPREDVTVHLLFAPTRVACMLAKLEIKQSGVRPSQPGVKFTIPLTGYGGTSNIILEDQRKQADGYVATLTDIAVGRVSKVCLCVRNTGSRAAFIKAVAFSDVQTRSVMEPSVISLAPSQFVLKERTQEVITVLMKSTQREQTLCQSGSALLASVCLFCGDEVSRQQYRRLLQSKPEAVRKALSENSLLRNINFNEKFLGEENITETYDLPQRPNEAHIFYGNMSKIMVTLLGNTKSTDCEQSKPTELLVPSARHSSETDSGLPNGNVSLDVLPVKGPQGPALRVTESSIQATESWAIHPEQLVLAAPTISGAATTSQVQIRNNTSRELSFDLSWPAHCLTITPQHGTIEPQCHLQILISPNPSLATKSALLPWSGQIYVQCDGQQKFIKVQIRQDLALDVSAAPADTTLSALPPQAATPVLPVTRLPTKPFLPSQTPPAPQALVEIGNKTIIFPTTPSGETSDAQLEVQNGEVEVRWYLSSFAPPYVKGVDNSGDVYRATYSAFRCSRVSGTLGAHEKIQVPFTFLPRDRGDYAQFWDLECHPVSEPQQKARIRFQLCGTGTKCGPVEGPQEGDCSLVKTEATVKTRKRADAVLGKNSQEEAVRRGVYSPQDLYTFPATQAGESSTLKVNIRNNSSDTHELKFVNPREPFHIKHSKYSLRSQHYLKLPVQFKPSTAGRHKGLLLIHSETSGSLVIQLTGEAFL
uniref:centrosomal protein of 192 kDa n=1 Tax=Semicossyphus pulcher TaxID=241346 RepID=UPI0037E7D549